MSEAPATGPDQTLLRVRDLAVDFKVPKRGSLLPARLRAVSGVDLDIRRGEIIGVVGESGCGKSTTGRAILQLLKPSQGTVTFDGTELTTLGRGRMRAMRRRMQMIFQDPFASLNPRMTIGELIEEPLLVHSDLSATGRRAKALDTMQLVGLSEQWHDRYPHEFSGGQRQRVGIARALVSNPEFVVADEPVSALDVSVQAQIVNLLEQLQEELGLTMMFIAHDLAVVRHLCDRIAVMYLGTVVEVGECEDMYRRPQHPYTRALLSAVPIPDPLVETERKRVILTGDVPSPLDPPSGCRFRTRCWKAQEICATQTPALAATGAGHQVACHFPENVDQPVASAAGGR
ncbi:peptide ABC transporter ATP-binding protein [Micromonospora echinospora]|uniref:Peptide/nickel transport system ATP-binding protein n=1 Tax=Micromonospora echinospora TaxID=1877 RepID=A0A1C4Y4A4_MICEC|nr:oligopeptide/dipeptide ABC transporter ATP-binding protein [Micromonospora echinospora]OZV84416.1 peptide ABC transporter ATP-binding protein [Micromonospora echinospora]SCF15211.1 peptide/nickel transport system ATP-binding protein [Micromonospora echinospora]